MRIRNLVLFIIIAVSSMWAQVGYHHPELDWYTITTQRFEIHYHEGAERSARIVAEIAEDIYDPITDLYGWEPDGKVHFIVKDHDDNANGAAFYYDNKVEIWAPQMTFILRGTHNWLRNVVTHEFSHMISLGAARKFNRHLPAFYFQWMNYEREKRPDVLYGYPNQLASYAVPNTIVPMWLAEGMAQYMAPDLDYERWDTHRDMLIRTAVYADDLHSFAEMGGFGKNSIGNERTYNAGYALTRYIAHHFGPQSLKAIAEELRKPTTFTVNGPIKKVTGYTGKELYRNWSDNLVHYYDKRLSTIAENEVTGEVITKKGIGNIAPAWSPNDSLLAYCGSSLSSYLTLTSLKLYDVESGETETLQKGVNSSVAWHPDGRKLLYSRKRRNKFQSRFNDLHVYNLDTEKEERLTHDMRVVDAQWSPDGETIVAVQQHDGTDNLILLKADGTLIRNLTDYKNGEGAYTPHFSPDGKTIIFNIAQRHGRDLLFMNLESGVITPFITDQHDARNPVFDESGTYVYFAWDETGIYNLYRKPVNGGEAELLTNVTGGAFMPDVSSDGSIAYSLFQNDGYKITKLEDPKPLDPPNAVYQPALELAPELETRIDSTRLADIRNYQDDELEPLEKEPYSITYGDLMFLPRVMVDSNRVKIGTYFYANDVLDRLNVFGGVVANRRMDLDAFLMLEYRQLPPTLFAEFYAFQRNVTRDLEVIEDYFHKVPVDIQFTMYEGDVGASYDLAKGLNLRATYAHSRYISDIDEFYFQPQQARFVSPANTYFIGNHLRLKFTLDQKAPGVTSSINPFAGREVMLRYSREYNKFFEDFSTEDENLAVPVKIYGNYNYNKLELEWNEFLPMPWSYKHALSMNLQGGYIDRPVDSFFNFFAGGLIGVRGYPFYSIEGRKKMIARFAYRFPVFSEWQKSVLHLTTDQFYLGGFFDMGNAFNGKLDFADFKRSAGIDARLKLFSFYGFPTALSVQAAYSLDEHTNRDNYTGNSYRYGNEWRYYFTLLFDFID